MTTPVAATATGGVESLTQALDKLNFAGTREVVAAFRIGWEFACLTDPSSPTIQSIQKWTPESLTEAAGRILRIESALADPNALTVTTETLPDAVVGQSISPFQLQASGGIAPYHWLVASGAMPEGLTLSDGGSITGTVSSVTDASGAAFNVQVADSANRLSGEPVGAESDVFSLGEVLTFAASGKTPFHGGSRPQIMRRLLSDEPDLAGVPEVVQPLIPSWLAAKNTGVPEGILVWVLLAAHVVPGVPHGVPGSAYLIDFIVVWLCVWLVAQGPMRIPFIRWRFRGGRLV
jgi:hypothetical protein